MRTVALLVVIAAIAACAGTQGGADRDLADYVDTLSAVDPHAHPTAYSAPGAPADSETDALPLGPLSGIPPFEMPAAMAPGNPVLTDAQRSLYGAVLGEGDSIQAKAFGKAVSDVMAKHGEGFAVWVLDQHHIGVMLANRVVMGPGVQAPRFRWVPFADALMLPLDTRAEAERTPDTRVLYPLETILLQRYLRDLGMTKVPATLDRYQHDVVTATLERQHAGGAVATKFEAAYLRPLDFDPADSAAAAAIYKRYAAGGVPTRVEYKLLQDYLVRFISREAGRLGMAIQIHSIDGFGANFSAVGAAPHHLESLVTDPSLHETHFVIVHGGWPRVTETLSLMGKANVYADISVMDVIAGPADLAGTLRLWLTSWPTKVMFGTDAADAAPLVGWDQLAGVASRNARRALSAALGAMVRDREITAERAKQLARMVMRENAIVAYRLDNK